MGEVRGISEREFSFSISKLSQMFGMARETVAARLKAAGVKADGQRGGFPIYRIRDAAPALVGMSEPDAPVQDPASMRPVDMRAYYQGQNERLLFEQAQGQLIPIGEVRHQFAQIAKVCSRHWRTLADVIERDTKCSPELVVAIDKRAKLVLNELADLIESDDDELRDSA